MLLAQLVHWFQAHNSGFDYFDWAW
jgi:hypothetical protein